VAFGVSNTQSVLDISLLFPSPCLLHLRILCMALGVTGCTALTISPNPSCHYALYPMQTGVLEIYETTLG